MGSSQSVHVDDHEFLEPLFLDESTRHTFNTNLKVAVFGGTGNVGKFLMKKLTNAGYEISMMCRNQSKVPKEIASYPKLTIIEGDLENAAAINRTVENADIVLSVAGRMPDSSPTLIQTAFASIFAAAEKTTAKNNPGKKPRCVFLTTLGLNGSHDMVGRILSMIAGKVAWADYTIADQMITDRFSTGNVPCIVVRPSELRDGPGTGRMKATTAAEWGNAMVREDVAEFFFRLVETMKWDNKAVQISGADGACNCCLTVKQGGAAAMGYH